MSPPQRPEATGGWGGQLIDGVWADREGGEWTDVTSPLVYPKSSQSSRGTTKKQRLWTHLSSEQDQKEHFGSMGHRAVRLKTVMTYLRNTHTTILQMRTKFSVQRFLQHEYGALPFQRERKGTEMGQTSWQNKKPQERREARTTIHQYQGTISTIRQRLY